MKINVYKSSHQQVEQAFLEITNQMKTECKTILFFASTIYHFETLTQKFNERFLNSEVVGVTTVGEIQNSGIHENSLVVVAFSGEDVRAFSWITDVCA